VKTGTKLFVLLLVFFAAVASVYWFVAYERAGATLLASAALMFAILAGYGARRGVFRPREADADPSDRSDARPADAAGETVGSFPLSSAWPPVFALGALLAGASLIFGMLLLPVGLALISIAVLGLMRESRS
jgi:hypothetical protein